MAAASSPRRSVLVTGAAGRIGSAFCRFADNRYALRLVDHAEAMSTNVADSEHHYLHLDLADPAACREACANIDTLLHLAADPNPTADFYGSLLDNNIKATYNIFRAAKDAGCRRVIYASSGQVFSAYPPDVQATDESPLRPMNMYGVTKCFGEAVAAYFAHAEGLSSVVVRIGAYVDHATLDAYRRDPNGHVLDAYISESDLNQLFILCIEAPDVRFAIAHGISNNRFKRMDLTSTRRLFGYAPTDNGFKVFADHLPSLLRS
jgi:NAD+ dependent glucose-6-phosphate dehydrogenase